MTVSVISVGTEHTRQTPQKIGISFFQIVEKLFNNNYSSFASVFSVAREARGTDANCKWKINEQGADFERLWAYP